MSYDFSADDIFTMAEKIEENGSIFYRQAAASVGYKDIELFLLELADMEDEHKRVFSVMKTELSEAESIGTVFDPQDEALSYLKALADIQIFSNKEIDASSMESILETAIMAEKDSIVFYLGMKNLVPRTMGRARLDSIIQEEMTHIKLLAHRLFITRV